MTEFSSRSLDLMEALAADHGNVFSMREFGYQFVSREPGRDIFGPGASQATGVTRELDSASIHSRWPHLSADIRQVVSIQRAGALDVNALGALLLAEARKAGASGVLLITAMLTDEKLRAMLDAAYDLGMFVLLEAFDENDLVRSNTLLANAADQDRAAAGQLLVGVNTRNLRTLEVDSARLERLAPLLPDAPCVAESGLKTADDAAAVAGWGYRMALVGSALMRSEDPAALVADMRAAGCARVAA